MDETIEEFTTTISPDYMLDVNGFYYSFLLFTLILTSIVIYCAYPWLCWRHRESPPARVVQHNPPLPDLESGPHSRLWTIVHCRGSNRNETSSSSSPSPPSTPPPPVVHVNNVGNSVL